MKEVITTTAEIAEEIAKAIARLNEYRNASAETLSGEKLTAVNTAVEAYNAESDEATKAALKLDIDRAIAEYNRYAALLIAKQLNSGSVDTYLNGTLAGSYDAKKFSRGKLMTETVYLTATAWDAINNGLRADKKLADSDPAENKLSINLLEVVPTKSEFKGAVEVLEVLCAKNLDFVSASPVKTAKGPHTVKAITEKVNEIAEMITGKNEDLYTWAGRACVTFSATYNSKKRLVKGAKDADFINLIFDIIRQKRTNVDKMTFASKASAFVEKKN